MNVIQFEVIYDFVGCERYEYPHMDVRKKSESELAEGISRYELTNSRSER